MLDLNNVENLARSHRRKSRPDRLSVPSTLLWWSGVIFLLFWALSPADEPVPVPSWSWFVLLFVLMLTTRFGRQCRQVFLQPARGESWEATDTGNDNDVPTPPAPPVTPALTPVPAPAVSVTPAVPVTPTPAPAVAPAVTPAPAMTLTPAPALTPSRGEHTQWIESWRTEQARKLKGDTPAD